MSTGEIQEGPLSPEPEEAAPAGDGGLQRQLPRLPARGSRATKRHRRRQQQQQQQPRQPLQPLQPDDVMRKVVQALAAALPQLAAQGRWGPLLRATQFLLWATHHAPGSASMFIAARGTARIQEAIRAAASAGVPAAVSVLQPGTALLLQCVQLSEGAADLVVESQSVRLLLQLLLRPDIGPVTKRHIGGVLQALAATKLVYRDVLHGAGVVHTLLAVLTDARSMTDLLLVQELLWVLISLSHDDRVYKDDMRDAALPHVLVALFSVYQASSTAAPELRPLAAQMLRALQLMADDDEAMQATCVGLGLIRLLVSQLHLDIHQLDEPPLPAAAANILTLNSLPTTPNSPHVGGAAGGSSAAFAVLPPASPLRRSGSGSGGSSPRPGSAGPGGARRPGGSSVAPPIPEEEEVPLDMSDSPSAGYQPGGTRGGRSASFANHGSEAGALRGLGAGPSPLQRVAAALLLRAILAPVMSRATLEVLLHGMLLPALHMQLVGPRLSLAMEATSTLRSLLAGSPERATAAAREGAAQLLVQLLGASNLELASTAAEVVSFLAAACPEQLEPLTLQAVVGLTELLRECGQRAHSMGLARRHSSASAADDRRRSSALAAACDSLAALPQGLASTQADDHTSTGVAPAQAAAGTVWAAEPAPLTQLSSVVLRHPSLSQDALMGNSSAARAARHSLSGTQGQEHLTSRERPQLAPVRPHSSCLVCSAAHAGSESCGFCGLSAAVTGLVQLLRPTPELQEAFMEGCGLEVVVGLMAGQVGRHHPALLAALSELLADAVANNCGAQDQVRLAGGIDVLSAALKQHRSGSLLEVASLCSAILRLLALLVADNSANKLCLRESGAFVSVAQLLDLLLDPAQADGHAAAAEALAHAVLQLLSACLPESPGSQLHLQQLGVTAKLLALLRSPSNSPSLGLEAIHVLGLLANRAQPGAQAEATAGGLVAVVMNVLQQQAMAGVLVSEVCMAALPRLLGGNPRGKAQALQYGVLPLLVHLLRSSPSPVTVVAAADTLAVLAERDTELQGQITAAGGLAALLDKLDPANSGASSAAAAPAAQAAAAAAATTAAEVVAKAAEEEAAARSSGGGAGQPGADAAADDAREPQPHSGADAEAGQRSTSPTAQLPDSEAAAAMAAACAAADAAATHAEAAAAAQLQLAGMRVRSACLSAVAALAHDNMFTKNTARQQGVLLLLVDLLRMGRGVLEAALVAGAGAARARPASPSIHQLEPGARTDRPSSLWQHSSHLKVRIHKQQLSDEQQEQQALQQVQLQMLVAAVHVLAELCHGNHSNQQAAAAEGLMDQLTSLAALAMGGRLEVAAQHAQLLAGICTALSAASEFCTPNKLVAREAGAVDVLSRLLLMAAEVPDVSAGLSSLRLFPAVSACCSAVVALAQDCEDNQQAFTASPDFLPALFRLLTVDDPGVATQAARALEFIAIRADISDDADDRAEFEADTISGLIRLLSSGALASSGSGRTAAARAALGGSGPPPSAAVVKEAAELLGLVVDASDPQQLAAGAGSPGAGGSGGSAAAGLGTAPAHPTPPPSGKQQQPGGGVLARTLSAQGSGKLASASAAPAAGSQPAAGDGAQQRPALQLLPAVVTDHTSGLAVLRTLSMQDDQSCQWQALVGRVAPAFQAIRTRLPPGPWKPFKQQVAWLLLLLAAKSVANRALIARVARTSLAPLALQLENAERFAAQAAVLEAAAADAAASSARADGGGARQGSSAKHSRSSSRSTAEQSPVQQVGGGYPAATASPELLAAAAAVLTTSGAAEQAPSPPRPLAAAAPPVPRTPTPAGPAAAADAAAPSDGAASGEDDELSMLQAEVAFLGLMSGGSSSGQRASSSRGGE